MIKDRDIIVVGLQPWDLSIGSNCKNIAMELSKNNRVLYVNPPLDRGTLLKSRGDAKVAKRIAIIKGRQEALEKINDNLWTLYPTIIAESINWISNDLLFSKLNRFNNEKLANCVIATLQELGFSNYILFNDQSMIRHFHFKELLKPELMIYYIRDNLATIPYFQRHALKLETRLIESADIVATNSESLAQYARNYNSEAKFVGQGCDFSLYENPEKISIPAEMLHFQRPTIGYVGALTTLRLDIALIESIAMQRPEWQIVLVGPEDNSFKSSNLHQLQNVHFTGNKPSDILPAFIKSFDVCINPQLVNEITKGNYPRKIDEYLAMGKPVVATKTPFMDYFKEYVYLATNANEYINAISEGLTTNTVELQNERRAFALSHSWENNVNEISKLIENKQIVNR